MTKCDKQYLAQKAREFTLHKMYQLRETRRKGLDMSTDPVGLKAKRKNG